ncbi:DUF1453 domain-containing protein [Streptomyces sp. NBC_00841]|uniref:DUF1453 domain-containing protein n=1 Tax=unclassified Streptomyces TaxID=2593676 RepID=UPI00225A7D7F|nr:MULTISPECIES: DUF1453 domain-containing protein [unclassified Streptomyces]MCX4532151.1 DUF1453 domain-containing protein [Streptomyces sp. NBC_01669]WSA02339.1 DUF1453 domain-containing protein [Streptomyces sp. NBC_00841]
MSGLINVLVIIAVIALVVVRQCSARRIADDRRWWVLPGILIFLSLREPGLTDSRHESLSAVVLGAELLVGLVIGVGWGWTTRLWRESDGSLWSRGTKATVLVWTGGLAMRAALYGTAALMGIRQGSAALMAALALTLLARSAVLTWRARGMSPAYGDAAGGPPSQPAWKDRV